MVYSKVLAISNCTETCLPIPALSKGERVLELASQLFVITKVVDKGLVGEIKVTISLQSCFLVILGNLFTQLVCARLSLLTIPNNFSRMQKV